jgi:membrane-associated protease RseP (regulator of RpoE activity)
MPSADPAAQPDSAARPVAWRTNLWLFLATVASAFVTELSTHESKLTKNALLDGVEFTVALLGILLAHELGHFFAARLHKVDATLPFFIPMPILSPFGTMGAVIRMKSAIPSRKALLDIGASGPLAGLAVAIPLYLWGAAHPRFEPGDSSNLMELGDSLLMRLLDSVAHAPDAPPGMIPVLSPIGFAAWGGMFVTMINLLPVGQLDAGHVAYALFGPRQNRIAVFVHRSLLAFFFVSLVGYVARDLRAGLGFEHLGTHVSNSIFWLVWFEVLAVLGSFSQRQQKPRLDGDEGERLLSPATRIVATLGLAVIAGVLHDSAAPWLWVPWFASLGVLLAMERRWGALRASPLLDHPPTGAEPLGIGRALVAVVTLLFFAALFMPTPISM